RASALRLLRRSGRLIVMYVILLRFSKRTTLSDNQIAPEDVRGRARLCHITPAAWPAGSAPRTAPAWHLWLRAAWGPGSPASPECPRASASDPTGTDCSSYGTGTSARG